MITINDITLFRAAQTCTAGTNEVRYYLQGVLLKPDGTVVGTDGHRMFIAKTCVSGASRDTIVRLEGVLPVSTKTASLDLEHEAIHFETIKGKKARGFSVINDKFPDYESITKNKNFGKTGVKIMGVNASYLYDVQKVMKATGCAIEFSDTNTGPIKVVFQGAETGPEYYEYIVMPVRVQHQRSLHT